MTEQRTCGQGLAAHAPLPAALGRLTAAVAEVLDGHLPSLDPSDAASRAEHRVYVGLVAEHRRLARDLDALGTTMAAQRDLPMGRHVESDDANDRTRRAFAEFVAAERALAKLLGERPPKDEAMLGP
jgi:hypothetical protein